MKEIIKNIKNKDFLTALKNINILLVTDPKSVEKLNLKGVILQLTNRPLEARQNFFKAFEINNEHFDSSFNLGNSFMEEENYDLAEKYFKISNKIQPKNFKPYFQLGSLFLKKRDFKIAYYFFEKSLNFNKSFPTTFYNLGVALKGLNNKKKSINFFKKAIEFDTNYIDAYIALAETFREVKEFNLSKKMFENAIKINPNYPYLKGALRFVKNALCDWDNCEKDLLNLEKEIFEEKKVCTPWQGLTFFSNPEVLMKNTILSIGKQEKRLISITNKSKKIRLAYISANFCEHAVSNQISKVFKLHDKNKFELIGIYLGTKKDFRLNEIKKNFHKFFDMSNTNTEAILNTIKNLDVDIAIDLMGFTSFNRIELFNKRCAPIQVSYLGFAGTTGLINMDYLVADKNVIFNEFEKFYSEKIIYLPHSFMPNNEDQNISEIQFSKSDFNFPKNSIIYCCFNKFYKITEEMFDLWLEILKSIENSVIWLNSAEEETKKNITQYSIKKGVDPKRIYFAKRSTNYDVYLSRHQLADIFLDTSPFSAHSTGCSSLIAGVPIVTLSGKTFANNVCSSLLKNIGLDELITKNKIDYKNKAISLGKNPEQLRDIKKKLKENFLKKPLFNSELYVQNLEKAFTEIYNIKIKNYSTKNIYIN